MRSRVEITPQTSRNELTAVTHNSLEKRVELLGLFIVFEPEALDGREAGFPGAASWFWRGWRKGKTQSAFNKLPQSFHSSPATGSIPRPDAQHQAADGCMPMRISL
jgi:hypothetical protein